MVWALDHNGTSQYSYTADDSISLSGDRYYEFKINTTTTTTETIFCLCNATGSGSSGEFLTITVNFATTGKIKIESSGYTPGEGATTVNDGVDHTIRLDITGSLLELYVDNVLDYSTTHTNPSILDGDFGLYMGCSKYFYADDAFRFFDGLIWDVDVNNQYFYSATDSDHNQSTNLVDNIAANDAIMVNMTTANWIDLGGGDNSLTVTEDSALSIADNTVTATVSTINENSSLSLTDATLISTAVSLIESSDIEIIDTTIVVFKTSCNSLTTTEDTELSLIDLTKVVFTGDTNEYSIRIPDVLSPVKIAWSLNPNIEIMYSSIIIQTTKVVFGINPNTENIAIIQDGEDNEH